MDNKGLLRRSSSSNLLFTRLQVQGLGGGETQLLDVRVRHVPFCRPHLTLCVLGLGHREESRAPLGQHSLGVQSQRLDRKPLKDPRTLGTSLEVLKLLTAVISFSVLSLSVSPMSPMILTKKKINMG